MCRRPIYFKGFHKVREQWDEDSWEHKCAEVYGQALDEAFEEAQEFGAAFGARVYRRILRDLIDDYKDIERTYNFLKIQNVANEDIEYVLMETDEYFSDRHAKRMHWMDEPRKELATRYPFIGLSSKGGKRCRAQPDEWSTLTFYLEV